MYVHACILTHTVACCVYVYLYKAMVFNCLVCVFPTAVGYAIFRGSNSQKNAFRQNPEYAKKKGMFY